MAWLRDIDRWLIDSVLPYGADFRHAAARVVGRDEADDIVQEAYARLLGYPQWRNVVSPRAFCFTVIRNLALERLRRAKVVDIDRISSLEAFDVADETPDSHRQTESKIELERLLRWINELPPQCAKVVRMRKLEGLGPSEIAVSLGISISTVETHLAKGLVRLTERMRETEIKGEDWPKIRARRQQHS